MDIKSVSPEDLNFRPLIFLDLETTGFSIHKHEIIEVGALTGYNVSFDWVFWMMPELHI